MPTACQPGAVQLNYGYGVEQCQRRHVEGLAADALILHLNPLQESVQTGGDTNFKGLLAKIEQLCDRPPRARHCQRSGQRRLALPWPSG
jgi:isopentenyl diphosphate isomerase/L-lactate dehydrogenase-like FMN-dependent dehydrogenase